LDQVQRPEGARVEHMDGIRGRKAGSTDAPSERAQGAEPGACQSV